MAKRGAARPPRIFAAIGLAAVALIFCGLWLLREPARDQPAAPERESIAPRTPIQLPSSDRPREAPPVALSAAVPSAGVRVEVRDGARGEPIAGAEVVVQLGTRALPSATTGPHGGCSLAVDFDPLMTLSASAEGFFPRAFDAAEVERRHLEQGVVLVELWPSGSLTVEVRDEGGAPISGAYIRVLPSDGTRALGTPRRWPEFQPPWLTTVFETTCWVVRATTDRLGVLEIPCLPSGIPLHVTASHALPDTAAIVTIPADTRRASVLLQGARGCALGGRVLDHRGAPMPGILVELQDWPSPKVMPTRTDGGFRFAGVRAGLHRWRIRVPGEEFRSAEVQCPETDLGSVRMEELHIVEFEVLDHEGGRVASSFPFTLTIARSGAVIHRDTMHQDGSASVALPGGEMVLRLGSQAGELRTQSFSVPCGRVAIPIGASTGSLAFQVPSFEDTPIRVSLNDASRASGAAAGFPLRIEDSRDSRMERDGASCLVRWIKAGTYHLDLEVGGLAAHVPAVSVEAGETKDLGAVVPGAGSIVGRVATAQGNGIPGYGISACAVHRIGKTRLDGVRKATSEADGAFAFERLPSGRWLVFPDSAGPDCEAARLVEVTNDAAAPCELVAGAPGAVGGTLSCSGAALPDARVVLRPREEGGSRRSERTTTTDAAGGFLFAGIAPGDYLLSSDAAHAATGPFAVAVRVDPAASASRDIDACSGLTRVSIRDGGAPVPVLEGVAHYPSGHGYLKVLGGVDGEALVRLADGPWLFAVKSPVEVGDLAQGRFDAYLFAYAGEGLSPPAQLELEIGTNAVEVRPAGGEHTVTLPRAVLLNVRELRCDTGQGFYKGLAYDDQPDGSRLFRSLPAGSRILLFGTDEHGAAIERSLAVEGRGARVQVSWP